MDIQSFEEKWKNKCRPDLKFPMHIRRKIFQTYKAEMFKDMEELIDKIINENIFNLDYYLKFVDCEHLDLGERRIFDDID